MLFFVGGEGRSCLVDDKKDLDWNMMRSSGDLVYRNAEGQMFYRGRIDEQVKRLGQRINLLDIEAVRLVYGSTIEGHII